MKKEPSTKKKTVTTLLEAYRKRVVDGDIRFLREKDHQDEVEVRILELLPIMAGLTFIVSRTLVWKPGNGTIGYPIIHSNRF